MQVDEFLKDSKDEEFLIVEEFDETWFADEQEEILRNEARHDLAKFEEHKVLSTHHEDCSPKETKVQLFKLIQVEFLQVQEAYTSPQP